MVRSSSRKIVRIMPPFIVSFTPPLRLRRRPTDLRWTWAGEEGQAQRFHKPEEHEEHEDAPEVDRVLLAEVGHTRVVVRLFAPRALRLRRQTWVMMMDGQVQSSRQARQRRGLLWMHQSGMLYGSTRAHPHLP